MQTIYQKIEKKLKNHLLPTYLSISDESNKHNSCNTESHFKIIIVTKKFFSQNMIVRHQIVYQLLANELYSKIHALMLNTYTPTEWKQRKKIVYFSPPCYKL
ncbi:transcriptional regulator BolA [Candidatus Arsenophonus lipoptenae]|uniref:Transcriptional regulator BolA n=1 Tax=Candidatus Arsenophonus lipoptenae TaxID=634113 RepID=A0A0X8CXV5_9GAMM|nr:BolA/IbaG family iron-sulfur metabolism protein [Candidatus Arsenophonus lipoptenae]AMA64887.1 transcriptional regulator BolA [Candidatus Arsenophonus lipoptenae]